MRERNASKLFQVRVPTSPGGNTVEYKQSKVNMLIIMQGHADEKKAVTKTRILNESGTWIAIEQLLEVVIDEAFNRLRSVLAWVPQHGSR
jgi:hypothetical protein